MRNELINTLKELSFWKNYRLNWVSSTSSTNDDLKDKWHSEDFANWLEVADIQTNGKGQYNRKWASDSIGQCLTFSFSAEIEEYEFPISMIAGIALATALEKIGLKTEDFWLKWPNDIWINDKKLVGILTESTSFLGGFRSVIGIGINILPLADSSINAISLKEAGFEYSREEVLIEFCKAWDKVFPLEANKQAEMWNKYGGQFWNRRFKVQIPNKQAIVAKPMSVNSDGSLIVKSLEGKEIKIISATLFPILSS